MDSENNQQPQAVVNTLTPMAPQPPKKKTGAGKKVLAVLLALLVLGGGVAYGTHYFTKQQAEEDAAAVIEPLQAQVAELEAKIAKQESTEGESVEGSYLEIEQWGVKVDISNAPEGIRYDITPALAGVEYGEDAKILLWYADEKDALGEDCSNDGSTTVRIIRSTKPTVNVPRVTAPDKKIGDYYYYIVKDLSGGACYPTEAGDTVKTNPTMAKYMQIHRQFIEVSESIEAL